MISWAKNDPISKNILKKINTYLAVILETGSTVNILLIKSFNYFENCNYDLL